MTYKVTFHISTLYIYQISSTPELPTLQDMKKRKEEKLIHDSYKQLPTHKWRPNIA